VRIEDQRGGNGPVPGTRRKAVPIAMATGPAEYTAGQQELPVRLTSLADMVQSNGSMTGRSSPLK
jgi:NADH-quinone oxidoreductase subunit B